MSWTLRKAIGHVGISLALLSMSVGTADALTVISDHDGSAPYESGEGQRSEDENSDQYRDSEVDDEESDARRDGPLTEIDVWDILDRYKNG